MLVAVARGLLLALLAVAGVGPALLAQGTSELFVIDFEFFADGTPIDDEYAAFGVMFKMENDPVAVPVIVLEGAPTTAFTGPGGSQDAPMSSGSGGLSDPQGAATRNIEMLFDPPVTSVRLFVIDIDGADLVVLRASQNGIQVASDTHASGQSGTGDGVSTEFFVASPAIDRVVVDVSANPILGHAVDFLSFTRPCPPDAACGLQIEVAQESAPGADDFDANVLGTILAFPTGASATEFFAYGVPEGASWNGQSLTPIADRSHLLFAETTDGLSLFVVHDRALPDDSDGGRAEMRCELSGDFSGAFRPVEDDPAGLDTYTGAPGDSIFTTAHVWSPCCTDGYALSGIDGAWSMIVGFTETDGSAGTSPIVGLSEWESYSADGSTIPLTLTVDRRVRLRAIPGDLVAVVPGTFDALPSAPDLLEPTVVKIAVANLGPFASLVEARFYDGDPDGGGALIGGDQGTIGFGSQHVLQTLWTPATPGTRNLFAVVDVLSQTETELANNRASMTVAVGAPPESITVEGGELTAWAGAILTAPVTVRNSGSGSVTIAQSYATTSWGSVASPLDGTTLLPGDVAVLLVDIAVPGGVTAGSLGGAPVDYAVPIAITTASAIYSDEVVVHVFDQPPAQVTVQITDASTGSPIAGALVTAQGVPGTSMTDGSGEVVLSLPEGARGFFAYTPGYVAAAVLADVAAPATTVTIALEPGQTFVITGITQQILTTNEIIARGITVNDPVNNVVVDFVVALQIGTIILPNVEIPANPAPGTSYSFGGTCLCSGLSGVGTGGGGGGGSGPGFGGAVWVGATVYQTPYGPTETWLLIPGSVTALQQFFEVVAYVANGAAAPQPQDVQMQNVAVALNVPVGLALPDLGGVPQTPSQIPGTIDAGAAAQATWVLRGDLPGTYVVSADATGDLHAFGAFVEGLASSVVGDPFDVVLPELRLDFATPQCVTAGVPFTFGVTVTNEGAATAQLVRVSLAADQLVNAAPCAAQPPGVVVVTDGSGGVIALEAVFGDVATGTAALAEFCLVPSVTGCVIDAETSIWASTSLSPSLAIAPDRPGTGGDCVLTTGINEPPNADSLKFSHAGETAFIHVEAPSSLGVAINIVAGIYPPGFTPQSMFPGIWLFGAAGIVASAPGVVEPGGTTFSFPTLPGYDGLAIVVQAIIATPGIGPGFCATDAHEFRILP